jgi:2-polyprenyl-3-methyl-5-hydroxy-6-metoxy-1,4-benzoquinol methylase
MPLFKPGSLRKARLSKAIFRAFGYPLELEERKMLSMFEEELKKIDARMEAIQPGDIPQLFKNVPLELFGKLLLDIPPQYPHIKAFFPSMPSKEVQEKWTGTHGQKLLNQSLAFMKTMLLGYTTATGRKIESASILDYGCGWGRLIRLLYKYVSFENIYGMDPWDESIRVCNQHGVKGNLRISEYVPLSLPFERQFDLIFALSVFTHLSEKTTHTVLTTLRKYISPEGILVITIRPKEYWSFHKNGSLESEMLKMHEKSGFAFTPHHNLPPINGDITYGDTSMTLDYIASSFPQWNVESVECNEVDLYQVILILKPV